MSSDTVAAQMARESLEALVAERATALAARAAAWEAETARAREAEADAAATAEAEAGAAARGCSVSDESVCSVCSRLTGFGDEDKGDPPVNLARCPSPGGLECRAVAQAVAPLRRENEVLRSNSDHLCAENASLVSQVESMAMRIESLAEELAKPEDVRLREVLDALDGRAVIFDGLGARVGNLLDEMDDWIERAGAAERRLKKAEEIVLMARQLSTAVWLYDQEAKS